MEKAKLLIVEDDEDVRKQMKWALSADYSVLLAEDRPSAMEMVRKESPSVITLDLGLPPYPAEAREGLDALSEILENALAKVIVITGRVEKEHALRAISLGAYDYFYKPIQIDELKVVLKRAFHIHHLEEEQRNLQKKLQREESFEGMLGASPQIQEVFSIIRKVATTDVSILITGESGTGKELFAKAIHSMSSRKDGPLITINCGALPDNLLESELFGYKAGAFTDAKKDKPGRITLAHGGTLFLDEIGDISPAMQVRLLRVLQEKVFEPLGGTKSEKVDVRIIVATNKDLEKLVREGAFRTDFYYRINVVNLYLPPLRERKEDIPLLAEHFIGKFNRRKGKDIQGFQPEALAVLMSHDYPGNIRELENIIEYAMVVCRNGLIDRKHLPDYLLQGSGRTSQKSLSSEPEKISLTGQEKEFIYSALAENNWSRKRTAARLGIHPSTLWRKIKRLNIELPRQDGRSR